MINLELIHKEVEKLRKADPGCKFFGADHHRYQFNKCLSETSISSFEKMYNFSIPNEFKEFLLTVGNGGVGPAYGIFPLKDTFFDFKLKDMPPIPVDKPFPYTEPWNEEWINNIDWDHERPNDEIVKNYMNVSHISGTLQIAHYGHGCTYLLVVTGPEVGNIWFDGRADYGGIFPECEQNKPRLSFLDWYFGWLQSRLQEIYQ